MPATTGQQRGVFQPAPERRHVFISYTRADRPWVDKLQRMMAPLLRASGRELGLWADSQIAAGTKWREPVLVSTAQLVLGFLMGQTPITQAQWRDGAGWKPTGGERYVYPPERRSVGTCLPGGNKYSVLL
jgi:hypothetical protein